MIRRKSGISGFSLIELSLTVAIVGLLASISIPNFMRFLHKARQAEAKTNLAGIYTAELGFYAESGSYSNCLGAIGFSIDGLTPNLPGASLFPGYYMIGWESSTSSCGSTGTGDCLSIAWDSLGNPTSPCLASDAWYWPNPPKSVGLNLAGICTGSRCNSGWYNLTKSQFVVGAASNFGTGNSTNATWDVWQIDDQHNLTNSQSGL